MRANARALLCLSILLFAVPLFAGTGEMAQVTSVIDGNTLAVRFRNEPITIRLIGVATPDPNDKNATLRKLGTEATEFLKAFLKKGWVYLEFPSGKPQKNGEGMIEAYAYRGSDGVFVNEKLITDGFGIMNHKQQFAYSVMFETQEKEARKSWRGVWNPVMKVSGKEAGERSGTNAKNLGRGDGCLGCDFGYDAAVRVWFASYEVATYNSHR
jgi:endonuclease YncB( thermonuclease family)